MLAGRSFQWKKYGVILFEQFIGQLNRNLLQKPAASQIETHPFAHFFGIEASVRPFVSIVATFELGQGPSGIDQPIVGAVVFIDHQSTVEDQWTLIDRCKSIVIHLFVVEAEERLECQGERWWRDSV